MEEHGDADDIALARPQLRHQRSPRESLVRRKDIVGHEVPLGKRRLVTPELVGQRFVLGEQVGGVEVGGGRAVVDAFPHVLPEAGP